MSGGPPDGDNVVGPWDLATEATREVMHRSRNLSRRWIAAWLLVAAVTTVAIAYADAPWPAHILPVLVVVVAILTGKRSSNCC